MDLSGMDLDGHASLCGGGCETHLLHHACYFFVAGTEQKLFLGSNRSHKQGQAENRAAVRKIQARVGLVRAGLACNREEPCTTVTHPPPHPAAERRKETSIFPPPLCT